jgi:hypothetical protein
LAPEHFNVHVILDDPVQPARGVFGGELVLGETTVVEGSKGVVEITVNRVVRVIPRRFLLVGGHGLRMVFRL